jgi:hypothetical protein
VTEPEDDTKITKIKQNEVKSKQGSVLAGSVTPGPAKQDYQSRNTGQQQLTKIKSKRGSDKQYDNEVTQPIR